MDPARRAFYRFHASLMEPWDGPAAVVFTDGTVAGGVLDRNGLRPARYWVTDDGLVVLASEVGRARHRPGHGGAQGPAPARADVPRRHGAGTDRRRRRDQGHRWRPSTPTGSGWRRARWISRTSPRGMMLTPQHASVVTHQRALRLHQRGAAAHRRPRWPGPGAEPVGSMGNDAAIAVLSDRPRLLYDYFTQLFAQVTNPPLDAIREELVTSGRSRLGPEGNLLDPTPASCRQIILPVPGHRQRRSGQAALRQRARGDPRVQRLRHRRALRPRRGRGGPA